MLNLCNMMFTMDIANRSTKALTIHVDSTNMKAVDNFIQSKVYG